MNKHVVTAVEHVAGPGLAETVYPETAAPPLVVGAVQLIEAWVAELVATATTPVGAPATVAGVAGAEAAEAGPVPAPFVATTVNV